MGCQAPQRCVTAIQFLRLNLLFTTAQSVDLLSTVLGLQHGMSESNPWLHGLSPAALVGIKALVIVGLLLVINRFISPSRRGRVLLLLTVLTVLAPIGNVVQIMLGLT